MIFELVRDYAEVLKSMPREYPRHRTLALIDESIRRDVHFLDRHPTTLFQCLWNSCWWFDSSEAGRHYEMPAGGWAGEKPPWQRVEEDRLCRLLERWRAAKEGEPGFLWLRSLRPSTVPLGSAQKAVLRGHEATVFSVAYSPDGQRLASVSRDFTLRIWDADNGAQLLCIPVSTQEREGRAVSVAFSPDGRCIAGATEDGRVQVWDAQSGTRLLCLRGHEDKVSSVAYSPDGRRLASGALDSRVLVWNAASGTRLLRLEGHKAPVLTVAFSLNGRLLASGSGDATIRIWNAASGAQLRCLEGHTSRVDSVAFSPDSRRLASGSGDRTVRIWDAVSGAQILCVEGCGEDAGGGVTSVSFSPDGHRLASGAWDNTVRIWDIESGVQVRCFAGIESLVESVTFSPDGRHLASGAWDATVRIWDVESAAARIPLQGHANFVEKAVFSPNGCRIATVALDDTVRVWDTQTGAPLLCLKGHTFSLRRSVSFSHDGRLLASPGCNELRIWDANSGALVHCLEKRQFRQSSESSMVAWGYFTDEQRYLSLQGQTGEVENVFASPDGRYHASVSVDDTVRLWDSDNGAQLSWFVGPECMPFSFGSRTLRDDRKWAWNAESHVQLRDTPRHEGTVIRGCVSPDGRYVASKGDIAYRVCDEFGPCHHLTVLAQSANTVSVWDAASGALLRCLEGHEGRVTSLAFSPDSRHLATGAWDNTVRIWDVESGAQIFCLQGHEFDVEYVTFSSDGYRLVSVSMDRTIRIWDMKGGTCLFNCRANTLALALPWLAVALNLESMIVSVDSGKPIAWLPITPESLFAHPTGTTWAAPDGSNLCLFTLEGLGTSQTAVPTQSDYDLPPGRGAWLRPFCRCWRWLRGLWHARSDEYAGHRSAQRSTP